MFLHSRLGRVLQPGAGAGGCLGPGTWARASWRQVWRAFAPVPWVGRGRSLDPGGVVKQGAVAGGCDGLVWLSPRKRSGANRCYDYSRCEPWVADGATCSQMCLCCRLPGVGASPGVCGEPEAGSWLLLPARPCRPWPRCRVLRPGLAGQRPSPPLPLPTAGAVPSEPWPCVQGLGPAGPLFPCRSLAALWPSHTPDSWAHTAS